MASTQRTPDSRSSEPSTESESAAEERSQRTDDASKPELSKDQTFDVLRNSRRRAVISCLRARGGELSVKEISRCVAAGEYDVPDSELSSEQYKRVYTGLYQCHLGRMEDLGVIDFDREANSVRLHDVASQLEPYLDDGTKRNTARIELGAAVVVASVVTLGATGAGLFGVVPSTPFALLMVVVLLALASLQLFGSDRKAR